MAKFSSRHKEREQTFFLRNFPDGLNKEIAGPGLPATTLTRCKNMKYAFNQTQEGEKLVVLKKRQGTTLISNSALPASADVMACTYYVADAHYILATSAKLYELNSGTMDPEEIGDLDGTPTFTEFHGKLIIHDSGVTKAWDGTTFETLTCLYQDEILGTGNNSTTVFSGTLSHPVVKVGSLTITYTDATAKTIVDDGDGTLSGDGTGTINYTTGAWAITCSGAPDNLTSIYAEYEKVAGAPKSKAGFVRQSRLYMWGDSDNPSRLWYSGASDEDGWDSSSSGGYLDVDPLDGYSLIGCLNYFQTLIAIKGNSLHRINDYPGDSTFVAQPFFRNTGAIAYRTCLSSNNTISYLSPKQGWTALDPTQNYGDISQALNLSKRFKTEIMAYANTANSYVEHNATDNQLWLTLFISTTQLPEVYVLNMETGGQLSMYEFAFTHSCYKFVNGEMLVGGIDGNLYRLNTESERFTDNAVSYTTDTFVRGTITNFNAPFNRKHNKKINVYLYGKAGATATLNIYKDNDFNTPACTYDISLTGGRLSIFYDGPGYLIYDMSSMYIGAEIFSQKDTYLKRKFNYMELQFELTDIHGGSGVEFYGLDFVSAVLGGQ